MGRTVPAVRFPWRWAWEAPLILATSFCVLGASFVLNEVARGLRTANQVHLDATGAKAMLAAEQASFLVARAPDRLVVGQVVPVGGGLTCRIEAIDPLHRLSLSVRGSRGPVYGYACELLPGGAPSAFGIPFGLSRLPSLSEGPRISNAPVRLAQGDFPRLAIHEDDPGVQNPGFLVRDGDLALLRLTSGTDLEDWTFRPAQGVYVEPEVPSGILRLRGHLWLDAGRSPVQLRLHDNLTMVVEGNIYFGTSLLVSGQGRLVLVAASGDCSSFRDLDGNGRWSAGDEMLSEDREALQRCIEGTGAVWLGLPGSTRGETLRVDAALVAEGEIQVTAPSVVVRGPLLGAHGVTGSRESELSVTGEYLPDVRWERIPGFSVKGPPRPGPLVPIPLQSARQQPKGR